MLYARLKLATLMFTILVSATWSHAAFAQHSQKAVETGPIRIVDIEIRPFVVTTYFTKALLGTTYDISARLDDAGVMEHVVAEAGSYNKEAELNAPLIASLITCLTFKEAPTEAEVAIGYTDHTADGTERFVEYYRELVRCPNN